jgi:hypothetical protein
MKSVIVTFRVNVDVEDDATDEQIQNDARGVIIDLMHQGWDVTITPDDPRPEEAP